MKLGEPIVSIVDVDKARGVKKAIYKAINLTGGLKPKKGSLVAIKPNLCTARKSPETGVITNVEVVKAIIDYLNDQCDDIQILIVESNSDRSADEAFRRLGYHELEDIYSNVKLKNLSKDRTIKIIPNFSHKISIIEIPETLLKINYLISVACLKRHVNERYTGIWKNSYGLLPYKPIRIKMHPFLSEVLFALNTMFWPDLSIIDAETALEGPGPIEGIPINLGKILCSRHPLAIDLVALKMIGEKCSKVPHIKYAMKHLKLDEKEIAVILDKGSLRSYLDFNEINEIYNLKFIPKSAYLLYRLSMRIRKLSIYLENIGYLFSLMGYTLRTPFKEEVIKGRIMPLKAILSTILNFILKIEVAERIYG